jgi:hypothetical protein
MSQPSKSPLPWIGLGLLLLLGAAVVWTMLQNAQLGASDPSAPPTQGSRPPGDAAPHDAEPAPGQVPAPSSYFMAERVGFAPASFDHDKLAQRLRQPEPSEPLTEAERDNFLQLARASNLADLGQDEDAKLQAQQRLQDEVRRVYGAQGRAGMRALMRQTWPPLRSALESLLQKAKTHNTPTLELIDRKDPSVQEEVAQVGALPELAFQLGLMSNDAEVTPRAWVILELLYRYRLVRALDTAQDPTELLTLEEVQTLFLWRLHEGRGVEPERRFMYATQLGTYVLGYPTPVAQGVVLFEAGQFEEARAAFLQAQPLLPSMQPLLASYLRQLPPPPAPAPDTGSSDPGAASPDAGVGASDVGVATDAAGKNAGP